MTLPPFVQTLAFWQALAYVIAALVAYLTPYKLQAGVLLAVILAVLKLFDISPQIKAIQTRRDFIKKVRAHNQPE